jgi:hypothetical protein
MQEFDPGVLYAFAPVKLSLYVVESRLGRVDRFYRKYGFTQNAEYGVRISAQGRDFGKWLRPSPTEVLAQVIHMLRGGERQVRSGLRPRYPTNAYTELHDLMGDATPTVEALKSRLLAGVVRAGWYATPDLAWEAVSVYTGSSDPTRKMGFRERQKYIQEREVRKPPVKVTRANPTSCDQAGPRCCEPPSQSTLAARAHCPKGSRARGERSRSNPAKVPGYRTVHRYWKEKGPYFHVQLYDRVTGRELGRLTARTDGENCYNPHTGQKASEIFESSAEKGWGPLLYDFAALISTNKHGMPLVSDRFTVSEDAKKVWDHYAEKRWDVPQADISSGSWKCKPVSQRAPMFGIRMPIYNFSEQWGVDGMEWLSNRDYNDWARTRPDLGFVCGNPRRSRRAR